MSNLINREASYRLLQIYPNIVKQTHFVLLIKIDKYLWFNFQNCDNIVTESHVNIFIGTDDFPCCVTCYYILCLLQKYTKLTYSK